MNNAEYRAHVHQKLDEMLDALDRNDMPAAMMAILGLREETTKHVEKELHKCTCGGNCTCKAAHSEAPVEPVEPVNVVRWGRCPTIWPQVDAK